MTPFALAPLLLALAEPAGTPALTPIPLDEALRELDHQSLTLAQARSRAEEASGVTRQVLAALLPTAAVGVSSVRNRDEAALTLPPPIGPRTIALQPRDSTTWTLSARVPLLAPSAWFDLAAAREAQRATALSIEATRLALRAGLAQATYLATATEEQVAALERAVRNADELVRSAARRVQAGTAAPLEVTRARAELVKRQSDLAGARAAVESAWLSVGVMLGRAEPVRVVVPDVERTPAPQLDGPTDGLIEEALGRRPELAAQAAQRRAAEAGVRSAWARLAPQVALSASAFQADVPYVTGKKDGWRATLDLSWQLYDGGYRYGKLRQAEAQESGAAAGAEAQRLSVTREVLDGRRSLEVAAERLSLAHAQAGLAADSAASMKRSFDAGVTSSLDVIDANDRLYLAESGLADARARLAQARLALELALGRGP